MSHTDTDIRPHHLTTPSSRAPYRGGRLVAVVACLLLAPLAARAQDRYLAFGDSVTEAFGFDGDCIENCGYPPRLEALLLADGLSVAVENHGLGGERTNEGVMRLETVLDESNAGPGDVLLLMEGTNDITRGISPETTLFNLDEMARLALLQGVPTIHATLIPRYPAATVDVDNVLNQALGRDIRDLAFTRSRSLADPWEVFSQTPDVFDTLYFDPDFFDPVGHPNQEGFDVLAEMFFDLLTGRDDVPPVVGFVEPEDGSTGLSSLARLRVRLYDFGAGISPGLAGLTVNGVAVPVNVSNGGDNWLDVIYDPLDPLPSDVVLRVQGGDRAFPPNTLDRQVATYEVETGGPDPCVPSPNTLCIDDIPGDRRFRIRMSWETVLGGGQSGQAFVTDLAAVDLDSGGLLSFFQGTPEMLIKVLDGCSLNGHFWIFGAPTTTLGYDLVVEDTLAKERGAPSSDYLYAVSNVDGNVAGPFADIEAFPTCDFSN